MVADPVHYTEALLWNKPDGYRCLIKVEALSFSPLFNPKMLVCLKGLSQHQVVLHIWTFSQHVTAIPPPKLSLAGMMPVGYGVCTGGSNRNRDVSQRGGIGLNVYGYKPPWLFIFIYTSIWMFFFLKWNMDQAFGPACFQLHGCHHHYGPQVWQLVFFFPLSLWKEQTAAPPAPRLCRQAKQG